MSVTIVAEVLARHRTRTAIAGGGPRMKHYGKGMYSSCSCGWTSEPLGWPHGDEPDPAQKADAIRAQAIALGEQHAAERIAAALTAERPPASGEQT